METYQHTISTSFAQSSAPTGTSFSADRSELEYEETKLKVLNSRYLFIKI